MLVIDNISKICYISNIPQIQKYAENHLNMIYGYQNCIEKYGSNHKLNEAIANNSIFKIEKGVYSDEKRVGDLEYISFVRKDAIVTLKTASYIYNLTDEVPLIYDLAIDRDASKTNFKRVKVHYYYQPNNILNIGRISYDYNGIEIKIYDKERLLIEIMRYALKLPFDYYKEVITNYRKINLDIEKIEDYLKSFKMAKKIMSKIRLEVM